MQYQELIKRLTDTLAEWERSRQWATIEIEVHDGAPVLLRKETKEKFYGGCNYAPKRESR